MASEAKPAEIIDLTEPPEVIELNSDGEVVPDTRPPANGSIPTPEETAQAQRGQSKKKRKKRKRKPTNGAAEEGGEKEDGEIATSSAEASRPQSRDSPNVDALELNIETIDAEGDVEAPPEDSRGKKTLADRLAEPKSKAGSEKPRESRRERREKAKKREREREKEEERRAQRDGGRERERDRDQERERRRSRSREPERHRDRHRDREGDRSRRRSHSRERSKRKREHIPEPSAPLFFEDVTPADVPGTVKPEENVAGPSKPAQLTNSTTSAGSSEKSEKDLLLPAHVLVVEGEEDADTSELKVPTPEGSDDDEDYIDYLDYDDDRRAPGMVRYWELDKVAASEAKAAKPSRFVCKNCGAEGEHKTYECPVLICLTCGARDEHSTRSCPISKTCFACGMKGHINKTCPNRAATRSGAYSHYQDCDRCGARTHQTNECPTLWRIYEYVGDEERQEILRVRETKRTLALGQGGEGYIATDEWCYNCGGSGHLGDDCNDRPKMFDVPREPSAFSLYNILSGPFSAEASRPSKRAPRDWETASAFADGFGFVAPMEVGKQGRKKERARLERRAREIEAEDEEDDWFGSARSRGKSGGGGGGNSNGNGSRRDRNRGDVSRGNTNSKIRFDFSHSSMDRDEGRGGGRGSKRQRVSYDDLPGPSRETDSIQIRGAAKTQDRYGSNGSSRYDRDQSSRGPRYRGGYSR
ncbi:hypothetical protein BV20DRAFT_1120573 [Pilatotrama ljubarskyi]|nr:hypothetical protein BV20DRAFT_1120573 [Pilatotrama ljubarskyi]